MVHMHNSPWLSGGHSQHDAVTPPPHQEERMQAILKEISPTQKHISVTNGTRYWRNSAP